MRYRSISKMLWLLVLTVALSPLVRADLWYDNYDKAENALAAQRWDEAIDEIQQALDKRKEPGVNVKTYGMNFINYHPYLKLGIAFYNKGQFEAALQAFDAEERSGAIARSPTDLKNLLLFRKLTLDAKNAGGVEEQRQLAQLIADKLKESRTLEEAGRLDDSLAAATTALAADPSNDAAKSAVQRLRGVQAARARESESEARVATLIQDGRQKLAASRYEEASSAFDQALAIRPDPEIRGLLDESQSKLRAALQTQGSATQRSSIVTNALQEAQVLEKQQRYADALAKIQTALAVEPENASARSAQGRIQQLQAKALNQQDRNDEITKLLAEGSDHLRRGRGTEAANSFNHVLALDPTNATATADIYKAFALITASIRGGTRPTTKLNPFIILAPTTSATKTGSRDVARREDVNVTTSAQITLAGAITASSAEVHVGFFVDLPDGRHSTTAFASQTLAGTPIGLLHSFSFAQPVRLEPGTATLRVLAIDPDGLIGTAGYAITYSQPWYRTSWFFASLVGLAVGAAGAVQWRRARRRQLAISRRFNPYIAGTPVLNEDVFFGREPLVVRVLQTIHNNSILLFGERRIGKTSLQHHIKKRLQQLQDPEYEFYAVYVDLQGVPQEKFFATLGAEIFHELAPILETSLADKDPRQDDTYGYEAFVRDLRKTLKTLRGRSSKTPKLVLLIDEVDELNAYDSRINQRLRSLFMKSLAENLAAVVSGVAIKKQWDSEGSPWYNFFEEIEVKPFARQDAVELIERPIRGVFQVDSGVTDRIIELTDCRPYLIQKTCVALVNRLHEQKRRRIFVADVDAVGHPVEA